MTKDPVTGRLRDASEPTSLLEVSDSKRRREVELLESLVVTTTLAEAYGYPDISEMLASACVRFARKIGEPPPVSLSPSCTD